MYWDIVFQVMNLVILAMMLWQSVGLLLLSSLRTGEMWTLLLLWTANWGSHSSFIASIIGQNCSKVDQLWSLVPVVYSWHFHYHDSLLHKGRLNPRTLFVSLLITLWGLRLSFNFWRKGGYGNLITHEEDYRWPILRKKMHPVLFLLFNLSFIATYQVLSF